MLFEAVLGAVFVQVALTFVLLFWMGRARSAALKRGDVKIRDIALSEDAWDTRSKQASNSYRNQFEIPVLFYAAVAFAMITRKADLIFTVLAWVFVISRVVHAYVHVTSNHVSTRFKVFGVGVFVLLAMWIMFAVRILVLA